MLGARLNTKNARWVLIFCLVGVFSVGQAKEVAIIIGQNYANGNLPQLKFSHLDAKRMFDTLKLISTVKMEDTHLLINQSRSAILKRMQQIKEAIRVSPSDKTTARHKLIFYYSGHADEKGVLIGSERISFDAINQFLKDPIFTISIGILDACYSGNIIAMKGGLPGKDFAVEIQNSNNVEGVAILASSSENQRAQEWESLRSSLFTHYIITGLKGAADKNNDRVVSVQELYAFTQSQVLEKTSSVLSPSQNPSYFIHFKGAGQVILANLDKSKSKVIFDKALRGTAIIHNMQTENIHEVKINQKSDVIINLPPAQYSITLKDPYSDQSYLWQVRLEEGDMYRPQIKYAVTANEQITMNLKGQEERVSVKAELKKIGDYAMNDLPSDMVISTKRYVLKNHAQDTWNVGFQSGIFYTPKTSETVSGSSLYVHFRDVLFETYLRLNYLNATHDNWDYPEKFREGENIGIFSPNRFKFSGFNAELGREYMQSRYKTEIRIGVLAGMSNLTYTYLVKNTSGRFGYLYQEAQISKNAIDLGLDFAFYKNVWFLKLGLQMTPMVSLYYDHSLIMLVQNWVMFTVEF